MKRKFWSAATTVALFAAAFDSWVSSALCATYDITPLSVGYVAGINALGESIGFRTEDLNGLTVETATVWSRNGEASALQGLGGDNSAALAINSAGIVAGWAQTPDGHSHAVVWSASGTITRLGELSDWSVGNAFAINARGQTAGFYGVGINSPTEAAAAWSRSGNPTELSGLGGIYGAAMGINNSGVRVGYSMIEGISYEFPVRWSAKGALSALPELGEGGRALAINNKGEIAGYSISSMDHITYAVLWSGNSSPIVLSGLGGNPTVALAINDEGQTVGESSPDNGATVDAMLWSAHGQATDLASMLGPGWSQTYATGINDLGQIVLNGTHDNQNFALLLTLGVPEPSTWAMMLVGSVGLGFARYRPAPTASAYALGRVRAFRAERNDEEIANRRLPLVTL